MIFSRNALLPVLSLHRYYADDQLEVRVDVLLKVVDVGISSLYAVSVFIQYINTIYILIVKHKEKVL